MDFAAQRHLPAIYDAREFVQSGGLISYGPSLLAMQQRVADYMDKIFKDARRRSEWGNPVTPHSVAKTRSDKVPTILYDEIGSRRRWAHARVGRLRADGPNITPAPQ